MKIDGSCHCGAIAYEAEIDPQGVYFCHCSDCQSISGGSGRWAVSVHQADFKLLSGEPKAYEKVGDSGTRNHQMFCATCASPIYSRAPDDDSGMLRLRLGTATQRDQLPPQLELWWRSAQEWADCGTSAKRQKQTS